MSARVTQPSIGVAGPRMVSGNVARWLTGACGIAALASLALPFVAVTLAIEGRTFEISGPAIVRALVRMTPPPQSGHPQVRGRDDAGVRALFRSVMRDTSGRALVVGVGVGLYLIAGPVIMAYFGIRYVLAALFGGAYGYRSAVAVVLAYALLGWVGINALHGTGGMPTSFFGITRSGFWLASTGLVLGGLFRR